jgi:hypothetical protein
MCDWMNIEDRTLILHDLFVGLVNISLELWLGRTSYKIFSVDLQFIEIAGKLDIFLPVRVENSFTLDAI